MAVPKRKTSISRKKMRRSHHKLSSVNIVEDKAIVHGAVGGSFLVGESAGHYGVKHGVKPVFGYAKERLRKILTGTPKTSNEQRNVKSTKACDYIVGK